MTQSLELWLVRHGETAANAGHIIAGWTDIDLNDTGKTQAQAAGKIIKKEHFDGVWSSDLQRTIHTARLAYGEPVQDARLREMNFGDIENCHIDDISLDVKKTLLKFVNFKAPGGEHQDEFRDRVLGFADTLCPGRHLVFTHGGVIRMFTQDLGEDRFINNGGIIAVDWTRKKILFVKEVSKNSPFSNAYPSK